MLSAMVESTFQLAAGIGPRRERDLWRAGITRWRDLPKEIPRSTWARSLPAATAVKLRAAIGEAAAALARRDADALASLLPTAEHWRLFAAFGDGAAYLDIETGDDDVAFAGISAIGILDREGPTLMLGGRDLSRFVERARSWSMLVTFNGLSYDVPILRRAFPEWQPPICHVDLRHVLSRLGHDGGLKSIERNLSPLSLRRPEHLDGMDGFDAVWLWRRGKDGDRDALRRFAEYNLYDAINLRSLMAHAYNAMVARETNQAPSLATATRALDVPGRGEVLYDVSKLLLSL
jgi:uncharacterized protein